MHLLNKAREYCNAVGCRRRILLKYFQEEAPGPDRSGTVACCDNCRQAASGGAAGSGGTDARAPRDVTREAAMLLMAVRECGEFYGLGMVRRGASRPLSDSLIPPAPRERDTSSLCLFTYCFPFCIPLYQPVDVLMGKNVAKVREKGFDKLQSYGKGKPLQSEAWWKAFAEQITGAQLRLLEIVTKDKYR